LVESLVSQGYVIIGHNLKYDWGVLKVRGLTHYITPGKLTVADTMVMSYNRDSRPTGGLSLDALTGAKTDVVQAFVDAGLLETYITKERFWNIDWSNNKLALDLIANYCVDDLKATHKLYKRLSAWYNQEDNSKFRKALVDIAFPMIEPLAQLEINGLPIHQGKLESLVNQLQTDLDAKQSELNYLLPELQWDGSTYVPKIKEYKGGSHNNKKTNIAHYIDSDGRVVCSQPYLVYNHCPLTSYNSNAATGHTWWLLSQQCPDSLSIANVSKKTKKPKLGRQFLTKANIPESLPIAKVAKLVKFLSMAASIGKHVKEDARLHTSFNNCLTRTGRLSSSNPNLQQTPRAGKTGESYGSQFRALVTARPGYKILVADLDRIELVVAGWYLAIVCGDKSWQDLCNNPDPKTDPHQMNADRWGMSREAAKQTVFSLLYGATGQKIMADGNAKTVEEGQALIDSIYNAQPALLEVKQKVWAKLRKTGYVSNIFGAHVPYPDITCKVDWKREGAERESFNCQIQRTAGDILHKLVLESAPIVLAHNAALVNIIHDECIVECPEDKADLLQAALNEVWNNRWDFLKGSRVNGDWYIADTWLEAKR
jgi:DNA polymerase I-like protein with 3'-5' exonuclease and polymerase domains